MRQLPSSVLTLTLLLASNLHAQKTYTQAPAIAKSVATNSDGSLEVNEPKQAEKEVDLQKGPTAQWIWGKQQKANERYQLRRTFQLESVTAASVIATADNSLTVTINGKRVLHGDDWSRAVTANVGSKLRQGENEIVVDAANAGGVAGMALKLAVQHNDGKISYIVSDMQWSVAAAGQPAEKVSVIGPMGIGPWGNVFGKGGNSNLPPALRDTFKTLDGFQVELLFTVPKNELGSWVSIAFDDKGRLIASDQGNKGLCRITPPPIGSDKQTIVEPLGAKITSAQGMLHAFGSLYISVNGGPGSGLYRARDTNGDDQYDEVKLLKRLAGGGEHGPHALRLSPDGNSIYIIAGNHTNPPTPLTSSRIRQNWSEDLLLPRQWDARGHARGKLAPGGWIAKTDPEGQTWELFSTGYRNPYDMDFNLDGELFAYDADMEWDMGTPWYRPTRVVHATSGSEFGWRSGTGKWPTYYLDSLPPAVNIGPGSPVGVTFGYGAKFPAKYQRALYILDWTFGTMYAVHLTPDGASYRGEKEEFLSRIPLPLTDAAVGPDGALYFTVGGRGTQSELYRVTYVGKEPTAAIENVEDPFTKLRERRRALEALHANPDNDKLDLIWDELGADDRHIRYAARTALEHLEPAIWQERALVEDDSQTKIEALAAFARQGDKQLQDRAIQSLLSLDLDKLSKQQRLGLYRTYQLLFARQGKPKRELASDVVAQLDPRYPADNDEANRELVQLLVYLNSPKVVAKTLKLMAEPREQTPEEVSELLARNSGYGGTIAKMLANLPELQNIHYAFVLRNVRYGWTLEQRKQYFDWLAKASQRSGGASYTGFIENIRKEALANASEAERQALAATAPPPKPKTLPKPIGPGRVYEVEELTELMAKGLRGRSFEGGKRAFAASRCIVCHRYDGQGGATGPDLSNVAARFQPKDLAEAIVKPSKVISDQYRAHQLRTEDGKTITGRLLSEVDGKVEILVDPEDASKVVTIDKDNIDVMRPSPTSLMPADLLKVLNEEEVADLLAYLLSRGNPEDPMFEK